MAETLVSFTDIKSLLENLVIESKCEIWIERTETEDLFVFSLSKLGRRVTQKCHYLEIIDNADTFEREIVERLISDFNEAPLIIL